MPASTPARAGSRLPLPGRGHLRRHRPVLASAAVGINTGDLVPEAAAPALPAIPGTARLADRQPPPCALRGARLMLHLANGTRRLLGGATPLLGKTAHMLHDTAGLPL